LVTFGVSGSRIHFWRFQGPDPTFRGFGGFLKNIPKSQVFHENHPPSILPQRGRGFREKKSLFLKKSGFVGFDAGLVIYFKKVKKVAGRTKSGRQDKKWQEGPKVAERTKSCRRPFKVDP
jgi:hypothetical protein